MKRLTSLHRLVMEDSFKKVVQGTTAPGSCTHDVGEYWKAVVGDQRLLSCKDILPSKEQVYNSFYRQRDSVYKKKIWDDNVKRSCELDRRSFKVSKAGAAIPGSSTSSIILSSARVPLPNFVTTPSVIPLSCGCQCSSHTHRHPAGTGSILQIFRSNEAAGSSASNLSPPAVVSASGIHVLTSRDPEPRIHAPTPSTPGSDDPPLTLDTPASGIPLVITSTELANHHAVGGVENLSAPDTSSYRSSRRSYGSRTRKSSPRS